MKVTHPKAILVILLMLVTTSIVTTIVQARLLNNQQGGNPNPVIEWVVLQLTPKTPGGSGISVTIQGYNFTETNNEVRSRGKVLKAGLASREGLIVVGSPIPGNALKKGIEPQQPRIISFELPAGIPCTQNEQCPLDVVNVNGTSNAVSFRLTLPQ